MLPCAGRPTATAITHPGMPLCSPPPGPTLRQERRHERYYEHVGDDQEAVAIGSVRSSPSSGRAVFAVGPVTSDVIDPRL